LYSPNVTAEWLYLRFFVLFYLPIFGLAEFSLSFELLCLGEKSSPFAQLVYGVQVLVWKACMTPNNLGDEGDTSYRSRKGKAALFPELLRFAFAYSCIEFQ
jgi:hypothetical protein